VTSTLDGDSELTLLLCAQTSLTDWLDLTVNVDESLEGLYIFVVKVSWKIPF
jgi:hypothetical protein